MEGGHRGHHRHIQEISSDFLRFSALLVPDWIQIPDPLQTHILAFLLCWTSGMRQGDLGGVQFLSALSTGPREEIKLLFPQYY